MQRAKTLTKFLKAIAEIVADEAERNPVFAEKLDAAMSPLPVKKQKKQKLVYHGPDIYVEFQKRGDEEFRFWLVSQDLPTLKAIVKVNGFDITKSSKRWTEPDKFVALIAEQVKSRLKRGSGFITAKQDEPATGGGAGNIAESP